MVGSLTPVAPKHLGEILVERELITTEQLEDALEQQRKNGKEMGDILTGQGLVTQDDLITATSLCLGIPLIDLNQQKPQRKALSLIPRALAKKYNVLPLDIVDNCLVLAMANPEDRMAYQDIQEVAGKIVEPVMATPDDIKKAINYNYESTIEQSDEHVSKIEAEIQEID